MFISKIPKYRQRPDRTIEKYDYYRLSENWRDAEGKIRKRTVVNLGELPGYTKAGRKELGSLLEEMIQTGGCRMSEDAGIYDDAVKFYAHWRDLHPKSSSAVVPDSSLGLALESQRRDIVTISLSKETNHEPRVIGPEVICRSTANRLGLMAYWIVSVTMYRLKKKGYPSVRWEEIRRIAGAQVIVTTSMETVKGETIEIRQATEEEQELARIYSLLDITPHPMGTRKFVGPPKIPP